VLCVYPNCFLLVGWLADGKSITLIQYFDTFGVFPMPAFFSWLLRQNQNLAKRGKAFCESDGILPVLLRVRCNEASGYGRVRQRYPVGYDDENDHSATFFSSNGCRGCMWIYV
jgi:hypothetical protein